MHFASPPVRALPPKADSAQSQCESQRCRETRDNCHYTSHFICLSPSQPVRGASIAPRAPPASLPMMDLTSISLNLSLSAGMVNCFADLHQSCPIILTSAEHADHLYRASFLLFRGILFFTKGSKMRRYNSTRDWRILKSRVETQV